MVNHGTTSANDFYVIFLRISAYIKEGGLKIVNFSFSLYKLSFADSPLLPCCEERERDAQIQNQTKITWGG